MNIWKHKKFVLNKCNDTHVEYNFKIEPQHLHTPTCETCKNFIEIKYYCTLLKINILILAMVIGQSDND